MIEPEDSIMTVITRSGWLCSRLMVLTTSDEAVALYNEACLIPQTETRAEVLRDSNIKISDPIYFSDTHTSLFLKVFEGSPEIPRVLKIPHNQATVDGECQMYEEIGQDADKEKYALVPVRLLKIKRTQKDKLKSTERVNWGILMPMYQCTLNDIAKCGPISIELAQHVFTRINNALAFLRSRGWVHGDLKPSNIFIAYDGSAWLGDYGLSCTKITDWTNFTGGTLMYQIEEYTSVTHPLFDKAGLCLSLIASILPVSQEQALNRSGNKLADALLKIETVRQQNAVLGDALASLLI